MLAHCSCHWDLLRLTMHIALLLLAAVKLSSALEAPSCDYPAAVTVTPQQVHLPSSAALASRGMSMLVTRARGMTLDSAGELAVSMRSELPVADWKTGSSAGAE